MTLRSKRLWVKRSRLCAFPIFAAAMLFEQAAVLVVTYLVVGLGAEIWCSLHKCPNCLTRLPWGENAWHAKNVRAWPKGILRPELPQTVRCPTCQKDVR